MVILNMVSQYRSLNPFGMGVLFFGNEVNVLESPKLKAHIIKTCQEIQREYEMENKANTF